MKQIRLMTIGAVVALVGAVAHNMAATSVTRSNASLGMTLAGAPLAIHGYDPVAYFTEGRAMLGSAKHTVKHDGVAFRFVSEKNAASFKRNPEKYAPQYGGYCAYGTSVGSKFDGDPRIFRIVNDKLYFNLNPDIKNTWEKDIPGNIAKADKQWTRIKNRAPSEL